MARKAKPLWKKIGDAIGRDALHHLVKFRVKPHPDRDLFLRVYVWPNRKAMWAFLKATKVKHGGCIAICTGYDVVQIGPRGGERLTGELGGLHFRADRVSAEIVSHECGHAALRYADRRGLDHRKGMGHEEPICYALGRMVHQVCRRFYTVGLWKT
jgi:hypothetical protein